MNPKKNKHVVLNYPNSINLKRSVFMIILLFFILLSCKKEKVIEIDDRNNSSCQTEDLQIDTIAKYYYYFIEDSPFNRKWYWYINNDTLEIAGLDETSGAHMYFLKKNTCIDFIKIRYILFDDNIVENDQGEIISGGYNDVLVLYDKDIDFKIQEYIEDSIFIGRIGQGLDFWMEFIPENNSKIIDWN